MEFLKGKLAVVTNAVSEIGYAIAEKLVDSGVQVLGLGTKVSALENISIKLLNRKGTFQYFIADLSTEQDIINAINWAKFNIGPVHVLVNNALVDLSTSLIEGRTADWRKIVNVNVIGLNVITREVVKNMMENEINGHVIHVNLATEFEKSRKVYKSTKQAVKILAECLRAELRAKKSKIKVTTLNTGPMESNTRQTEDVEGIPTLKCENVVNAIEYILSSRPIVQINELTLSAV